MPPPTLRILTHNVRGRLPTGAHLAAFLRQWHSLHADVVCLQETGVTMHNQRVVLQRLQALSEQYFSDGWRAFWTGGSPRHGVAVLVRRPLVERGEVQLGGGADVRRSQDSRYLSLPVRWGGHSFTLTVAYLPSGNAAAQRQHIEGQLATHLQHAGHHIVAGDFNFVLQPPLDRLSRHGGVMQPGAPAHQDTGTAQRFTAAFPDLVDTFRHLHPHRRAYSFHGPASAARLDRIHASAALLPFVLRCDVAGHTASDHRPVFVDLLARPDADAVGPGLPRVRMHFAKVEGLRTELVLWLGQQAGAAPADPAGLLAWWPGFKRRLATKARRLSAAARAERLGLVGAAAAAQQAMQQANTVVDQGAGDPGALDALVTARRQYAAAAAAAGAYHARAVRATWLHAGERPCPLLTRLVRPPQDARLLPALRPPGGHGLVDGPRQKAQLVARFWAGVSRAPAPSAERTAATAAVLAALAQHGPKIEASDAAALGAAAVAEAAVRDVLRAAPSGRAPGLDGVPVELYRVGRHVFVPLLARLFSAIGQLRQVPPGFLHGAITVLPKRGDPSNPANYRPITLLNSDYRLLARVLANRLTPVLGEVIEPEQTAFLPGRSIGENVLFLQTLPTLLRRQRRSAVVAFLDIAKAYDTVDREFLTAAINTMGGGDGFVAWVTTLLTHTRAVAVVNGHVSELEDFGAGVRQGCPLSPALYLFVAQAQLTWLRCHGHGLHLHTDGGAAGGPRVVGAQFADDAQVLLTGLTRVPALVADMEPFRVATNQSCNWPKSAILLAGDLAGVGPVPDAVHGIPVVAAAHTLGLDFSNDPAPVVDWPALLHRAEERYEKVARLPLSTFGRAFGASGYGLSRFLYHAEFSDMPPAAVLAGILSTTGRLVDAARPPADRRPVPTGVPHRLLAGHPTVGGFGLLPLEQHIRARHAVWGVRLACSNPDDQRPWVMAARGVLATLPHKPPPLALFDFRGGPAGSADEWRVMSCATLPPGTLRRLAAALAALPRVGVTAGAPPPGPWCHAAPLWGNPCLRGLDNGRPVPLAALHTRFINIATLRTVGDLVALKHVVDTTPAEQFNAGVYLQRLHPAGADLADRHHARQCVQRIVSDLPDAWWQAAVAAHHQQHGIPPPAAAVDLVVASLGWGLGDDDGASVGPKGLSVRLATALQMGPVTQERAERTRRFVVAALEPAPPVALGAELAAAMAAALAALAAAAAGAEEAAPAGEEEEEAALAAPAAAEAPPAAPAVVEAAAEAVEQQQRQGVAGGAAPAGALPAEAAAAAEPAPPAPAAGPAAAAPAGGAGQGAGLGGGLPVAALLPGAEDLPGGVEPALDGNPLPSPPQGADPAGAPPLHAVEQGVALVGKLRDRLWRKLKWENHHKEPWWRLAVDGVPNNVRLHRAAVPCHCGGAPADRRHHFWACPVAQAVVAALQAQLPGGPIQPRHVWLMVPPAGVQPRLWEVVCLAAVEAMEAGRKALWAAAFGRAEQGGAEAAAAEPLPAQAVAAAAAKAVACFWGALEDLVADGGSHRVPVDLRSVPPQHPFLRVGADGDLVVHRA